MQRYSSIIGRDVICPSGKRLGEVKEAVFLPDTLEFAGLVVGQGGLGISRRAVLREDILNMENNTIKIRDPSCLKRMKGEEISAEFRSCRSFTDLSVKLIGSGEIGFVKDVLFDYRTGRLECVELGDGIIQDVLEGRRMLPLIGRVEMAKEHMLVSREAVEEIKQTGGGLSRLLGKE